MVCAVVNICSSTAAQVAIDVGGKALLAKYSRDDEAQSDSAAVGYLLRAGINPRGIPQMFERMAAVRRVNPSRQRPSGHRTHRERTNETQHGEPRYGNADHNPEWTTCRTFAVLTEPPPTGAQAQRLPN